MTPRNMANLGDLERAVMDVVWDAPEPMTAMDLRDALASSDTHDKELAITTIMTVLTRLEGKGYVLRDRRSRPHLYRAAMHREDHIAELMHEVLGTAPDRDAVLARFVGQVSAGDAERLRSLLDNA